MYESFITKYNIDYRHTIILYKKAGLILFYYFFAQYMVDCAG